MKINELLIKIALDPQQLSHADDLSQSQPDYTVTVPTNLLHVHDMPLAHSGQLDPNPVMISPQQQHLELKKAELGKISPAVSKLLAGDTVGQTQFSDHELAVLKNLAGVLGPRDQ